jgi:hypothetical protein
MSIDFFYDFFTGRKYRIFLIIVYSLMMVVYFFFFTYVIEREPSKINKARQTFYERADKCLVKKDVTPISANDPRIVFNSVDRDSEGVLKKYGYISLLEDYLVHLKTDNDNANDQLYNPIAAILDIEKKEEPYSRLSSEESRLMKNIDSSVRNNDVQTAMLNLSSLSDVLRINNDNLEKLERQNAWSIPLAFVGLIITILFGIISIIRPFQVKKNSRGE